MSKKNSMAGKSDVTRSIGAYEKSGFEGVDVNLRTSLFEYGLIWKEEEPGVFLLIYGVGHDGEEYNLFDSVPYREEDFIDLCNNDWFSVKDIAKMSGQDIDQWTEQPLPYRLYDAAHCYGCEDVFGPSYYPFKVSKRGGTRFRRER